MYYGTFIFPNALRKNFLSYIRPAMELNKAYKAMMKAAKGGADCGLSQESFLVARYQLRNGRIPKDTTMRKRLKKAGWKLVQDEQWEA
ncbi:MAG TPA: hypothetical protein PLE71_17920 [Flavobacteriales bacterium]|nr:hypothetical protein [Flavobacteriales bacterium]